MVMRHRPTAAIEYRSFTWNDGRKDGYGTDVMIEGSLYKIGKYVCVEMRVGFFVLLYGSSVRTLLSSVPSRCQDSC